MRKFAGMLLLVLLTAALVACGGSGSGTTQGGTTQGGTDSGTGASTGSAAPKTVEIGMYSDLATNSYYFDPIGVKINPGDTVRWVNQDTMPHNAQSEDGKIPAGAQPFASPMLNSKGETYEVKFDTPGTYIYFCLPHKALNMYGMVVVGEPGGPGSEVPQGVPLPSAADVNSKGTISFKDFSG